MFSYSMVQLVRTHADKLEPLLRQNILHLYKPFNHTPCFLHKFFEKRIRKNKKLSVIFEFHKDWYDRGCMDIGKIMRRHRKNGIRKYFPRVACCSVDITPNALEETLSGCNYIKKVYLNSEVKALLDVAVPSVHAKGIKRNGTELTGDGVKIAIIDTGIHPHPDLAGRITDFADFVNYKAQPYDDNGHGTHCAGCAASASPKYTGPAPKAKLVGVKVLDKIGSGSLETVMEGVEWCIQYNEEHSEGKIDIISLSIGSSPQNFGSENADPMVRIVEEAWAAGITVCVAAGNEGPESGSIASPGISSKVITVGAFDDRNTVEKNDDDIAGFSSRGPTRYNVVKPDILAPGVNIVSLRSPKSYLDKLQKNNRVERDYFVLSGTSMATPICAGVVALIKESNPELTPDDIKKLLKENTDLWQEKSANDYGSGRMNAEQSIPHPPLQ